MKYHGLNSSVRRNIMKLNKIQINKYNREVNGLSPQSRANAFESPYR